MLLQTMGRSPYLSKAPRHQLIFFLSSTSASRGACVCFITARALEPSPLLPSPISNYSNSKLSSPFHSLILYNTHIFSTLPRQTFHIHLSARLLRTGGLHGEGGNHDGLYAIAWWMTVPCERNRPATMPNRLLIHSRTRNRRDSHSLYAIPFLYTGAI